MNTFNLITKTNLLKLDAIIWIFFGLLWIIFPSFLLSMNTKLSL